MLEIGESLIPFGTQLGEINEGLRSLWNFNQWWLKIGTLWRKKLEINVNERNPVGENGLGVLQFKAMRVRKKMKMS